MTWAIIQSVLGFRDTRERLQSKLVVGLGNPGKQYSATRHNAGFWCVERLAEESSITISNRRRYALVGEGTIAGVEVVLAKPRTFMNNSGAAIAWLLARYGASPTDLLVVYDDMDLAPGKLRLRPRGSAGGHNGMRSIIGAIRTQDFARIRIGIGRPSDGVGEIEHVLGTMTSEERKKATNAVEMAAQAVSCILAEGFDIAMNRFN